jgi:hypothetical protein
VTQEVVRCTELRKRSTSADHLRIPDVLRSPAIVLIIASLLITSIIAPMFTNAENIRGLTLSISAIACVPVFESVAISLAVCDLSPAMSLSISHEMIILMLSHLRGPLSAIALSLAQVGAPIINSLLMI